MIYTNEQEVRMFRISQGKQAKERKIHEKIIHKIRLLSENISINGSRQPRNESDILRAVCGFLDRNNDFLDNFDGKIRDSEEIEKELRGICRTIYSNSQYFSSSTKALVAELFSLHDHDLKKDLSNVSKKDVTGDALRFFPPSDSILGDTSSVVEAKGASPANYGSFLSFGGKTE